ARSARGPGSAAAAAEAPAMTRRANPPRSVQEARNPPVGLRRMLTRPPSSSRVPRTGDRRRGCRRSPTQAPAAAIPNAHTPRPTATPTAPAPRPASGKAVNTHPPSTVKSIVAGTTRRRTRARASAFDSRTSPRTSVTAVTVPAMTGHERRRGGLPSVRPPQDERAVAAGRALAAGHDPDLTRGAGREHAPARLHDLPQRLDLRAQPLDLRLEGEDPLDAREVDALLDGEALDLAQDRDVPQRVAPPPAGRASGRDDAEPVVLAQGLRVHPGELGRDGDDEHAIVDGRHGPSSAQPL